MNVTPETVLIADSLQAKYNDLKKIVNDLSVEATLFHSSLSVNDTISRNLFNSLSRISAMADQMQIALTLMNEDMNVVEAASADPVSALWKEQLESAFEEYGTGIAMTNTKIH